MEAIRLLDGGIVRVRECPPPEGAARAVTRIGLLLDAGGETTMTSREARAVGRALFMLADTADRADVGRAAGNGAAGNGAAGNGAAGNRAAGPWEPGRGDRRDAEEHLRFVIRHLSRENRHACTIGSSDDAGRNGLASVFRQGPSRSLLVVGETSLARGLRELIAAGEAPGWDLYRLPADRTPVSVLVTELERQGGGKPRFANALRRSRFTYVEEIAAVSDEALMDAVTGGGVKFVDEVRRAIRSLGLPEPPAVPGPVAEEPAPAVPRVRDTARENLGRVIRHLAQFGNLACTARAPGDGQRPPETAHVVRQWPQRSLLVVGETPLAYELRELIAAGEAPGWDLHQLPPERTSVDSLAAELWRMTGRPGFGKIVDRAGFAWVEEITAISDEALACVTPGGGVKFADTVRKAIRSLGQKSTRPPEAEPDLGVLADELLGEMADDLRRLVLREWTFAPGRGSVQEFAREIGVPPTRVGELEMSALGALQQVSRDPRYAPLRDPVPPGEPDHKRPWLIPLTQWLTQAKERIS